MTDAIITISKEEGIIALYSGIKPAILRQAVYGTIKFGTYYTLKKLAVENGYLLDSNGEEYVWGNIICATLTGSVSSAIANPTDVLKVRMQVKGNSVAHKSLSHCFKEIYKNEGVGGLWKGVGPTANRAATIAAVELPVYDFCKFKLMSVFGDHVANHFMYVYFFNIIISY